MLYILFLYPVFLGIAPAIFICRVDVRYAKLSKEAALRCGLLVASLVLYAMAVISLSAFYASSLHEHKPLRYYANLLHSLYSARKAMFGPVKRTTPIVTPIGLDAKILATDVHRELVIMVAGQTARADRFSRNGYERKAKPLLEQVVSYTNFRACGTSTAEALPCIFSPLGREQYTQAKAAASANALALLARVGVNVLWLDNNSTSKGGRGAGAVCQLSHIGQQFIL